MAVTSDADSSSDIEYSDIDEREAIEDGIDSDGEIQRKFAKGEIAPGLHGKIQPQTPKKEHKNNLKGLRNKLIEIKMDLPWIERFDLINEPAPMAPELSAEIAEHSQTKLKRMKGQKMDIPMAEDQIHDDFQREMQFYRQGQAAVMEGYSRLTTLDLPTNRPEDYFAQMAKSDEHMQKVRRRLVKKQIGLEISERVKKIREMKKYGKKVQLEVEKRKQQEKKEMMTKVKMFRKHKSNTIDFLEEGKNQPLRGGGGGGGGQNKPQSQFSKGKLKRSQKDKAYGFGGRKKNMKRNRGDDTWGDGPLASKKSKGGPMQGRGNKNKKSSKRGKGRR